MVHVGGELTQPVVTVDTSATATAMKEMLPAAIFSIIGSQLDEHLKGSGSVIDLIPGLPKKQDKDDGRQDEKKDEKKKPDNPLAPFIPKLGG